MITSELKLMKQSPDRWEQLDLFDAHRDKWVRINILKRDRSQDHDKRRKFVLL